jgi:ribonuclease BN (tRNA processing enzyme)
MKIKVIGSSGAELPGHHIPALLLNEDTLLDAGSFTEVLNEEAQFAIKNIFVTHAHLDHLRGIPFFAENIFMRKISLRVNVFSTPRVLGTMKRHLFNGSIWPDFTAIPDPDNPILNFIKVKVGHSIALNDHFITPYAVKHVVPAVGYLVEDGERRLFYTGDIAPSSKTWQNIGKKKIHCLIIDVSFPNNMEETAVRLGHLTPNLLEKELVKMFCRPDKIYISHMKPQYAEQIISELERLRIENLLLLRSGDTITI